MNSIEHVVFNYLIVNPVNNTVAGIVYNENMTQMCLMTSSNVSDWYM